MLPARPDSRPARRRSVRLLIVVSGVLGLVAGATGACSRDAALPAAGPSPAPSSAGSPAGSPGGTPGQEPTPPAGPAPADLPVIDYLGVPAGFPADPASRSTGAVTEGLHPTTKLAVYDAPGGRPRAFLPPTISGVPVTVPVVARRTGWVAVLLPSVNRTTGWIAARGWIRRPVRDQLVLRRRAHELTWTRAGVRRGRWTVAVGAPGTPTPSGRTFVLGRTKTSGAVYAGLDALVLGSVPDDQESVPAALRGAHTGIHAWHRSGAFGRSVSNGCIRMPRSAQRILLRHIAAGTPVIVLD